MSKMSEIAACIQELTQARPEGYQYMPSYRARRWDGYIRLTKGNVFPTGLLHIILEDLQDKGYQCEYMPYMFPEFGRVVEDCLAGITLRDYQVEAANLLLSHGRGIAKMATNSGKTEVIAAIASVLNGNVLVLVHRKELLHQTAERLQVRTGEPVGKIGDGLYYTDRLTVGMLQTLVNRPFEDPLDCVCFDECHHGSSQTAQEVMYSINAPYRFGFSGTPLKYDDLADLVLMGATGPVLVDISNEDLIELDISAKPIVYMGYLREEEAFDADYHEAYDSQIVNNQERNEWVADVVSDFDGLALILVERIEHGQMLESMIENSIFVHGSMPSSDRMEILDLMRDGLVDVVIATPIFDEGVDVPSIDMLVLAGGGKGHIKLLQRLGRGMRAKPGENVLYVVDFIDDTNKYLLEHSLIRCEIYEQEGFEVEVVE